MLRYIYWTSNSTLAGLENVPHIHTYVHTLNPNRQKHWYSFLSVDSNQIVTADLELYTIRQWMVMTDGNIYVGVCFL